MFKFMMVLIITILFEQYSVNQYELGYKEGINTIINENKDLYKMVKKNECFIIHDTETYDIWWQICDIDLENRKNKYKL